MKRWNALLVLSLVVGCRSAQLRGPGPYEPPAVGHPSGRSAAMAPGRNSPSHYGWGSAYDPHTPGSRAQPAGPSETGAIPPWTTTPFRGRPIGVPPPATDPKR